MSHAVRPARDAFRGRAGDAVPGDRWPVLGCTHVTMPAWRQYLKSFIVLTCVVVSVAGMVNVFSDNADVEAKAKVIGCPRPGVCNQIRLERSVIAQTFHFQSTLGTIVVRCARSSIFFGDYGCAKE
jgi:hypothetical protein